MSRFYTNACLYGKNVLVRGWDDDLCDHFQEKIEFHPTMYLKTNKPSVYKTLDGSPVSPVKPGNLKEAKEFVKTYQDVSGVELYGMERFLYQYLAEEYPETIDYDTDRIKIWSMDIETKAENGFPKPELAEEEVLLITLKNFKTKNIITFGTEPFETDRKEGFNYVHCFNEEFLLCTFIEWWDNERPDIVTGWNVNLFDITYLCNRIANVLGDSMRNRLSPWRVIYDREVYSHGRTQQAYEIVGVSILDYLDIYKKFTYTNRESYALDVIAEIELGEKKLDHSEHDTFRDFYTNDWKKFVEYNIHDVNLVDKMEEKMKLISLIMMMAYDAHCNYNDTFSEVRLWDVIIYNYLRKFNIVLPPTKKSNKTEQFAGAFVKEPTPGVYDYVVSFDLNSLYPSLIRFLNISPETVVNEKHPNADVEKMITKQADMSYPEDYAIAANGAMYRKDILGFMPAIVKKMYDERVRYKENMLACEEKYETNPTPELEKEIAKWSNYQMVRKICLNSLYGALGNQYFRHFRIDNAEAITLSGRVVIQWIERKINELLNKMLETDDQNYIIAVDTDSVYINLGPLVKLTGAEGKPKEKIIDALDSFCKNKIVPYIDKSYQEYADYVNCYENTLVMKRECITEKGIWTAKKRYILNVWDKEGVRYKEPKLKMMGIEAVRSSTPAVCRQYITEALKIVMSGTEDELINYIDNKRTEFKSLDPYSIGISSSANNVVKYTGTTTLCKPSTPIAVRAALIYNKMIRDAELTNKYSLVQDGDKIKFLHLTIPNQSGENVFGFMGTWPSELGLTPYIDYDTMYDKTFVRPMKTILDIVGWNTEKTNTLERFFV